MNDSHTPETADLPDDEEDLRRRLAELRANRPKAEEASRSVNDQLMTHVGRMARAIKQRTPPANADEMLAVNEALTKMAQGLHDAWVTMGEEEARVRQALSILTAERLTEASVRAARSTRNATWFTAIVAAVAIVVSLVVSLAS